MQINLDDLAARLMEQLRATEHQFIGLQAQLALVNQLREEARRVAVTTPDPADPDWGGQTAAPDRPDADAAQSDTAPHDGDRGYARAA